VLGEDIKIIPKLKEKEIWIKIFICVVGMVVYMDSLGMIIYINIVKILFFVVVIYVV